MCPLCISTLAWVAVGTGSAGAATALLVKKLRVRHDTTIPGTEAAEEAPSEEQEPK